MAPGTHGSTFGGRALACAVAVEFFEILDELLPQIRRVGDYFRGGLRDMQSRYGFLTEVRGEGLMVGMQLAMPGKQIVDNAMQDGLLINCTHEYTIRLLPPFIVTRAQVREFLKLFEAVLAAGSASLSSPKIDAPVAQSLHSHATAR